MKKNTRSRRALQKKRSDCFLSSAVLGSIRRLRNFRHNSMRNSRIKGNQKAVCDRGWHQVAANGAHNPCNTRWWWIFIAKKCLPLYLACTDHSSFSQMQFYTKVNGHNSYKETFTYVSTSIRGLQFYTKPKISRQFLSVSVDYLSVLLFNLCLIRLQESCGKPKVLCQTYVIY